MERHTKWNWTAATNNKNYVHNFLLVAQQTDNHALNLKFPLTLSWLANNFSRASSASRSFCIINVVLLMLKHTVNLTIFFHVTSALYLLPRCSFCLSFYFLIECFYFFFYSYLVCVFFAGCKNPIHFLAHACTQVKEQVNHRQNFHFIQLICCSSATSYSNANPSKPNILTATR